MGEFKGLDLSNINIPKLNFDISALTGQMQQQNSAMKNTINLIAEHNRKKDAALFETAESSVAQKELLAQQLVEAKEQNKLLKDNYTTLRELYEMTKREAESSANEAKKNRIFGWVSLGIGTFIGVAGIIVGIII
ncbi:MAG: hypothetical protein RR266_02175 [Bacilli bacterium]